MHNDICNCTGVNVIMLKGCIQHRTRVFGGVNVMLQNTNAIP